MAGELTIEKNADGTATINFPGGGSHTVTPDGNNPDAVAALQDAYGDRIGNVVEAQSQTSTTNTTSNSVPAWVDPDYGYDVNKLLIYCMVVLGLTKIPETLLLLLMLLLTLVQVS